MSIQNIPAKSIITCDRCGAEGERGREGAFQYGGLHIRKAERWGSGWNGDIGGAQLDYDLCSICANAFSDWLRSKEKA